MVAHPISPGWGLVSCVRIATFCRASVYPGILHVRGCHAPGQGWLGPPTPCTLLWGTSPVYCPGPRWGSGWHRGGRRRVAKRGRPPENGARSWGPPRGRNPGALRRILPGRSDDHGRGAENEKPLWWKDNRNLSSRGKSIGGFPKNEIEPVCLQGVNSNAGSDKGIEQSLTRSIWQGSLGGHIPGGSR